MSQSSTTNIANKISFYSIPSLVLYRLQCNLNLGNANTKNNNKRGGRGMKYTASSYHSTMINMLITLVISPIHCIPARPLPLVIVLFDT